MAQLKAGSTVGGVPIATTNDITGKLDLSGWIPISNWSYASATTITVPAGALNTYRKGNKVRFKQGGAYKYFYIINVADTLLTLTGGIDYSITSSAITDIYYSNVETPIGFPDWFNWTPTLGAVSPMTYGATTIRKAKFCIKGLILFYKVNFAGTTGGSASALITFTLPVTGSSQHSNYDTIGNGEAYDASNNMGYVRFYSSSRTTAIVSKYNGSNWGIGAHREAIMIGQYEI